MDGKHGQKDDSKLLFGSIQIKVIYQSFTSYLSVLSIYDVNTMIFEKLFNEKYDFNF